MSLLLVVPDYIVDTASFTHRHYLLKLCLATTIASNTPSPPLLSSSAVSTIGTSNDSRSRREEPTCNLNLRISSPSHTNLHQAQWGRYQYQVVHTTVSEDQLARRRSTSQARVQCDNERDETARWHRHDPASSNPCPLLYANDFSHTSTRTPGACLARS